MSQWKVVSKNCRIAHFLFRSKRLSGLIRALTLGGLLLRPLAFHKSNIPIQFQAILLLNDPVQPQLRYKRHFLCGVMDNHGEQGKYVHPHYKWHFTISKNGHSPEISILASASEFMSRKVLPSPLILIVAVRSAFVGNISIEKEKIALCTSQICNPQLCAYRETFAGSDHSIFRKLQCVQGE